MMGLTSQQRRLLDYIASRPIVAPSFEEMRAHMGLASKSGIHRLLTALEKRKCIRRIRNSPRAIEVIATSTAPLGNIPIGSIPTDALVAELNARGFFANLMASLSV
jgi:SOS-response transcriptional repressor LexA